MGVFGGQITWAILFHGQIIQEIVFRSPFASVIPGILTQVVVLLGPVAQVIVFLIKLVHGAREILLLEYFVAVLLLGIVVLLVYDRLNAVSSSDVRGRGFLQLRLPEPVERQPLPTGATMPTASSSLQSTLPAATLPPVAVQSRQGAQAWCITGCLRRAARCFTTTLPTQKVERLP